MVLHGRGVAVSGGLDEGGNRGMAGEWLVEVSAVDHGMMMRLVEASAVGHGMIMGLVEVSAVEQVTKAGLVSYRRCLSRT